MHKLLPFLPGRGGNERMNGGDFLRKCISAQSALSLIWGLTEGHYCHFIPEHFLCNVFFFLWSQPNFLTLYICIKDDFNRSLSILLIFWFEKYCRTTNSWDNTWDNHGERKSQGKWAFLENFESWDAWFWADTIPSTHNHFWKHTCPHLWGTHHTYKGP